MKPIIDRRSVFLLLIMFLLVASTLLLLLTSNLSAHTSLAPEEDAVNNIYLPVVANDYPPPCWQGIANGSFEDESDWILPVTEYPAVYSTTVAYSGIQSMHAGISDSLLNRFSYSSARQTVTVPTEAISPTLNFLLYPMSSEPTTLSLPDVPLNIKKENAADSGDAQLVLILDSKGDELERLLTIRGNEQLWTPYSFDLSHYAGQTIQIYFGVYNNGWGGVTSMFVDDVSLESCEVPPPPICWQGIVNESFEEDTGWMIPITEYPAAYSTDQANSGNRSMRTGIIDDLDNRFSYSSTNQVVAIPAEATDAAISFSLFPTSTEPAYLAVPAILENLEEEDETSWGDVQTVIIYDMAGIELERLVHMRRSDATWLPYSFDLSDYAGETVRVYFGVINNGQYGITGMYVDDVSLQSCNAAP